MRIVLDTNIFISGIFWTSSPSGKIILAWRRGVFMLITSNPILKELVDKLSSFKIEMDKQMIEEWKQIIVQNAIVVKPSMKLNIVKDDPDDNMFLEAAIEGNADYIVSQDKHLLKVSTYKNVKILTPKDFLGLLNRS
tara:strand:- start:106 stop:516 length:411 start_codon:yes stop_codon:yes gene_type:complete